MSIPFSHFFTKINQISPLEHNFTSQLGDIVLKPKTLYFYGNLPENMSKSQKSVPSGSLGAVSAPGFGSAATISAAAPAASHTPGIDLATTPADLAHRPKSVAIVGSRHNTKYGEEIAYQLAYALAKHDVVIVSGLAYGIDSIAHQGCLDAGGTTVAVLGTAINDIYPKNHLPLAERILEKGAILSEYAPRTKHYSHGSACQLFPGYANAPLAPGEFGYIPEKSDWLNPLSTQVKRCPELLNQPFPLRRLDHKLSFLYRNRLIAGLADIVVVVEAAERSGSLNTAGHAIDQGKEVFAVPGNINSVYSRGCNVLIAHGATPYSSPDDILRLLFPNEYQAQRKKTRLTGSTPAETAILETMNRGFSAGEDIMKALHISPAEFNQLITLLELKSRVRALGANRWSLI